MRNIAVWSYVIFIGCIIGSYKADAFACFKCNSNEHENCVNELDGRTDLSLITECDTYCTILRTEYTDIPGMIVTLVRDCEEEPTVLNGIRTDKHYTKMYTSCNSERCNDGDGKREPGDENGGRTGPKNVNIVYESDACWSKPSYILTLLGAICIYLLN